MRVVITGAAGFVGSRLCQWLRASGHDVLAVGRRMAPGITDVADLTDPASLGALLAGADAVLHAAASVPGRGRRASVFDNVTMAQALAVAAADARVPVVLLVSSTSVYGMQAQVDQASTPEPDSAYGASKLEAEQALAGAAVEQVICVRAPLVYAAGMGGFYGRLTRLARAGVPLPLAHLTAPRTCVSRDNLCALLLHCLTRAHAARGALPPAPVLCGDSDLSLVQLLRAAAPDARLFAGPDRMLERFADVMGRGHDWRRLAGGQHINYRASHEALEWQPPVSVDEGLRELAAQQPVDVGLRLSAPV